MDLRDKLLNIIKTENKKDPFTDARLSKLLSTTRENITNLRKELNIGNSRERRKPSLIQSIEAIVRQNSKVTVTDITKQLMELGFDISRRIVEEILSEEKLTNKVEILQTDVAKDPFESLVGYNGSLKQSVMQSKSSILYPPNGLPTLIVGESGVGKTQFAECMYKFAKQSGKVSENVPFVIFNCADYGDNPQLLLSLLYGYKKGAFTGAENDTEGVVEKANNGILFLDEIHRLPPKGQEILFSILDRGKFRRLGETGGERDVNIMFIGATTENIESSLLLTFRRRIPMIIKLPSLHERLAVEKIELIYYFFQQECNRINLKIFLESKVIEILTLKRFHGNIGQLKSTIQVICARAFMKHFDKNDETISIGYNEILELNNLQQDLILEDVNFSEVRNYVKDVIFIPFINDRFKLIRNSEENDYSLPEDFYRQIEKKYQELRNLDIDSLEVEEILWTFIINKFNKLEINASNKNKFFSLSELVNLVDRDIVELIKDLRARLIKEHMYSELNENVFTYLAIHLEETIKRLRLKQQIININLAKIKKDIPEEYKLAESFATLVEQKKKTSIPEDEIGFIAMYIKAAIQDKVLKNRIGVIVLSHGRIATETVKVAKELLGVNFPVAIDMPLDENPSSIYEKVVVISKVVDEGQGILFLVDMGSLTNVGKIVSEKLGIKTRTIDRVDLVTVLEAVKKVAISEKSLDETYYSLIRSRNNYPLLQIEETDKPMAIVALCLTGAGMAFHIKESLEKKYSSIHVFQMSILDEQLAAKIQNLKQEYKIMAIIGTINPEIEGINFIPYEPNLLTNGIGGLEDAISMKNLNSSEEPSENILNDDLILFEPDIYTKKDLLEVMSSLLINRGYVKGDFLNSVFNREEISPTFLKGGIAMPHGDNSAVLNSTIVFVKLKRPIDWGVGRVDVVCLPALRLNDKKVVKNILKVFLNSNFIESVKGAKDKTEFKKLLLSGVN